MFRRELGDIDNMAQTIRKSGILQPLIVRPTEEYGGSLGEYGGLFQIVVGYRRFEAGRRAGFTKFPCIIRRLSDSDAYRLNAITNIQREGWNPIEEAKHYREWRNRNREVDIAREIGKSQPYVSNMIRLLELPEDVQNQIAQGRLTKEHGFTLLRREFQLTPEQQSELGSRAVDEGLTTKQLIRRIREEYVLEIEWEPCSAFREIERRMKFIGMFGSSAVPKRCVDCAMFNKCKKIFGAK